MASPPRPPTTTSPTLVSGSGGASSRATDNRLAWSADEITAQILEWAVSVLPETPGNAPALNSNLRKSGIELRLVRVTPRPLPKGATAPFVIDLEYLLTLQLHDAASEQHALGELMFAAMANRSFEVAGGAEVERVCQMLGMSVAPGFILRAPLVRQQRRATPTRTIEQIRLSNRPPTPGDDTDRPPHRLERTRPRPLAEPPDEPLAELELPAPRPPSPSTPGFRSLAGGRIEGRIIGPRDEAIGGAIVEAEGGSGSVETDENGRFHIEDAGPEGAAVRLLVRAQGSEFEATAVAGLPLTVRLPLGE